MSNHTETGETRRPSRQRQQPPRAEARPLELVACGGCGRHFATDDGPGMIAVIKGPCPDCGGRFELASDSSEDLLH